MLNKPLTIIDIWQLEKRAKRVIESFGICDLMEYTIDSCGGCDLIDFYRAVIEEILIVESLTPELQINKIPTYLVPGIATVLSAQMMSSLKLLLREYSDEKNITQRQVLKEEL